MSNKIALVTGSSRGIGRGIALALAKAGYDIGVHYFNSKDSAEEVAAQITRIGARATLFKADLKNVNEIKTMFQEFYQSYDHIDLLVNNAGITKMASFTETTEEMFNEIINTDLRGAFFCAQEAARNMISHNTRGTIINITSNHSIGCWPDSTVYAAAKAGLDKLTKNMALELAKYNIRVIAIAPGYTQLEWFPSEAYEKYISPVASRIPLKRFATPDEIGQAVVFLASEKASYITGTTLFIDGGAILPVVAQNEYV